MCGHALSCVGRLYSVKDPYRLRYGLLKVIVGRRGDWQC